MKNNINKFVLITIIEKSTKLNINDEKNTLCSTFPREIN